MNTLKTYLPKINLGILILFAFVMPIGQKALGLLIGLFALFMLIDGLINKTFKMVHKDVFITGVLFFLIHLISVAYSDNQERAWFDIEVKLSLIIFPVIFLFKSPYLIKNKKWVLYSFVYGSIASSIIMLIKASQNYSELGSAAFYYANIALFHPSYMAMYFIFAIGILIDYMISKKNLNKFQILPAIGILFLLRMIFLLQSKAGMLSIIVIATFLLILSLIRLRSFLLKIAISILVVSLSLVMVQKSSRLQAMMSSVKEISEKGQSEDSTTGIRFAIWEVAAQEIKNSWIIGVGAGDIKPVLFKDYERQHLNGALEKNLNVHNQYIETFLGQGIIGFLLLIGIFLFGFKHARKRKEILGSIFMLLILLSFGPESMLNNQMGVIFIAFFYFFLFQFDFKNTSDTATI